MSTQHTEMSPLTVNYNTFDDHKDSKYIEVEGNYPNRDFCSSSSIRDFVTMLALSFHAVFEGLAIGLEPDTGDVWKLFAGKFGTWALRV